jgi:methylphosphotriester-DNA--protein-cysteine methyltransferase
MKKYGQPDYCPSATRHHKKAKETTGTMPNAIWFKSVREAIRNGYSPCGNCWLVGEKALERWQQYLDICEALNIDPIPTPKKIKAKK